MNEGQALQGERISGYRPLYRHVKDVLLRRLSDGTWTAGQILPSEPEIAVDLGVSPGTVRKALDEMASESLVVRRQGRGTFVARHDDARILFQFFRLAPDAGEPQFPESRILSVERLVGDEVASAKLGLSLGADVVGIERVRSLGGHPVILERIVLPDTLFPGLEQRGDLPNNLYALYAGEYGVTIARAAEHLKAISAGEREVLHLHAELGEALMLIDRVAQAVDGRPVEWRRSICRTAEHHYRSDLR